VRTTLTLDTDITAKLNAEVRRSGKSFKEVVNETLRVGLNARREFRSSDAFKVRARKLGTRPGLNYDNIGELLEQIEEPRHK
jgi:hypothetical protein